MSLKSLCFILIGLAVLAIIPPQYIPLSSQKNTDSDSCKGSENGISNSLHFASQIHSLHWHWRTLLGWPFALLPQNAFSQALSFFLPSNSQEVFIVSQKIPARFALLLCYLYSVCQWVGSHLQCSLCWTNQPDSSKSVNRDWHFEHNP